MHNFYYVLSHPFKGDLSELNEPSLYSQTAGLGALYGHEYL